MNFGAIMHDLENGSIGSDIKWPSGTVKVITISVPTHQHPPYWFFVVDVASHSKKEPFFDSREQHKEKTATKLTYKTENKNLKPASSRPLIVLPQKETWLIFQHF